MLFNLPTQPVGLATRNAPRSRRVEHQSHGRGILRLGNLLAHFGEPARRGHAHRQVENVLGQLHQPPEVRTASGEHDARRDLRSQPSAAEFVANQQEQLVRARLDDFKEHARENRSRGPVAHAGDLDSEIFRHQLPENTGVLTLDLFGFGHRSAQTHREVVRKMVAADRNRGAVPHHSPGVGDQFGGAAAHIEQTAAQFALVLRQASFGGSEWLQHRVVHADSGAVHGSHDILCGRA